RAGCQAITAAAAETITWIDWSSTPRTVRGWDRGRIERRQSQVVKFIGSQAAFVNTGVQASIHSSPSWRSGPFAHTITTRRSVAATTAARPCSDRRPNASNWTGALHACRVRNDRVGAGPSSEARTKLVLVWRLRGTALSGATRAGQQRAWETLHSVGGVRQQSDHFFSRFGSRIERQQHSYQRHHQRRHLSLRGRRTGADERFRRTDLRGTRPDAGPRTLSHRRERNVHSIQLVAWRSAQRVGVQLHAPGYASDRSAG